jgi:hypothetical protein
MVDAVHPASTNPAAGSNRNDSSNMNKGGRVTLCLAYSLACLLTFVVAFSHQTTAELLQVLRTK